MPGSVSLSVQRTTDTSVGLVLQFPNGKAREEQSVRFGELNQLPYSVGNTQGHQVDLPDTKYADRYRTFNEQLNTLTKDHAQLLFSGKKGLSLTEQNIAVLDLLARYRTGAEIQQILNLSESRISQHKRSASERIQSVTGLKTKTQGELTDAFVVLRHRLQKPVYSDRKLTPLNNLLKQVEPDQSAQDILDVFTSDEFKVLLPELEAGGLRAVRARLGRLYPILMIVGWTTIISIIGGALMIFTLGLDALGK